MPEEVEKATLDNKDPIQKAIGSLGKWQIWMCAVIFLMKFPVAWHQMSIIFLAPKPEFTCANVTIDKCSAECPEYIYDRSVFEETIMTEWDLVCEKGKLANLSQTIIMFGILVGSMVFGSLADKFGRRGVLVIAVILQLVAGVLAAFSPWFWMFVFLRFLTAVATGGTMVVSFVLVMEIIGVKWRDVASVLYQIPLNMGHFTLAVFAYYIRDWRKLQFALSIPSVILLSYYWLIPESPRWLFTVGRIEESSAILEKAAKMNKLPHANIREDLELAKASKIADNRGNFFDLFRTPNLRKKTLFICFNWFVCGLDFFGIAFYIGSISGNKFANVAFSAILELMGDIACIFLLRAFGRKKTLIFSNSLCGIVMLIIAIMPPEHTTIIVVLASFGIMGIMSAFSTVYLYGGELFPTVVRNIGIGTASMVARFGSMIAPFAVDFVDAPKWVSPLIFGIIPLIGAALVVFLPETRGQSLPDTLEDGENFGKKVPKTNDTNQMHKI